MTTSELFDAILETLATPIEPELDDRATAQEAAAASKANAEALALGRELQKRLKEAHPDRLLYNLHQRELQLTRRHESIARVESSLVASAGPSPDDQRLRQEAIDLQHREQSILRASLLEAGGVEECRSLPVKFIRADATAHFEAEVNEAEAELSRLERKYGDSHLNPFGRTVTRMAELKEIVNGWPKAKKLASLGEQVHAIRERQQQIRDEREALAAQRRREVLGV